MRHRPVLVTPPSGLPVTVDECKAHAVVDHNEDDSLVYGMIAAAVSHLDGFRGILGRCIMPQTWQVGMDALGSHFVLPVPDVSAVSIAYDDADGAEQTVDPAVVRIHPVSSGTRVDLGRSFAAPALSPDAFAPVRVNFTAGFEQVPEALRRAIMRMVAMGYDERHSGKTDPITEGMIAPYRWWSV